MSTKYLHWKKPSIDRTFRVQNINIHSKLSPEVKILQILGLKKKLSV